jgi:hypothetical protein
MLCHPDPRRRIDAVYEPEIILLLATLATLLPLVRRIRAPVLGLKVLVGD